MYKNVEYYRFIIQSADEAARTWAEKKREEIMSYLIYTKGNAVVHFENISGIALWKVFEKGMKWKMKETANNFKISAEKPEISRYEDSWSEYPFLSDQEKKQIKDTLAAGIDDME